MNEIKYFGKSPREIAEKYFDRANLIKEGRTEKEIDALYEGFVEGLTYIYPMYHNSELLVESLTQTKTKNTEDYLTLFQKLPRLNHRYEVKEDGDYIPTLYSLNGNWFISWLNFDDDEVLDVYWANTIEEVVKQAFDGFQAKVIE